MTKIYSQSKKKSRYYTGYVRGLFLDTTHPVLAELAQPPARLPAGGPEIGASCYKIKENCILTWLMMKAVEKGADENK